MDDNNSRHVRKKRKELISIRKSNDNSKNSFHSHMEFYTAGNSLSNLAAKDKDVQTRLPLSDLTNGKYYIIIIISSKLRSIFMKIYIFFFSAV